jgi:hypothetical protein
MESRDLTLLLLCDSKAIIKPVSFSLNNKELFNKIKLVSLVGDTLKQFGVPLLK